MNQNPEAAGKPSIFAADESAVPPDETSPEASADAGEAEPVRDLPNDLHSVFLAATAPLTLHEIQDELNAPGRGVHVPTGPIDTLLDEWTRGDNPRVAVVKLGDPVVEHYHFTTRYRDELENPGLVVERRAAVLSAMIAPWVVDPEEEEEPSPGDGQSAAETIEILGDLKGASPEAITADLDILTSAGILAVCPASDEEDPPVVRYMLAKGAAAKLLAVGAPALAATTLPPKNEPAPEPDAEPDAEAEKKRRAVEEYVLRLNEKLDEQTRRAQHFTAEAHRYASQVARYELWARKGGFNIDEITAVPREQAGGPGVPWTAFRIVDETELRRLVHEEDRLDEALTAAKKTFDSAKSAYAAVKTRLEERLALVKLAQRSPSYTPEKLVNRIARDGRIEVVSADEHDKGDHLEWEDPPVRAREVDPVVDLPEPPPPVKPAPAAAPATPVATSAPAPATAPAVPPSQHEGGTNLVQTSLLPAEPPAEEKVYAGMLNLKAMAPDLLAVFEKEPFGVRGPDVLARFEAIHGKLPGTAAKLIEPALRFVEGRGDLCSGDMPGTSGTEDPVRLYWHKSFTDPRQAPPPAPAEPEEKATRKAKKKGADEAPSDASAPEEASAEPKAAKGSKAKKKAAAK